MPDRRPSNVTYLSIYEGLLCQRRAVETPGFVEYVSRNPSAEGRVVWVREREYIRGYITNFEAREKENFNKTKRYKVAQITFQHESGLKAIVEVGIRSELVARFALCVENMDLTKPVWMRSFRNRDGQTVVMFKQDDHLIAQKYTKEQPNGLPPWRKDPISGDWDTREYWTFLFDIIKYKAMPIMADVKTALDGIAKDDQGTPPTESGYSPAAPPEDPANPDDDIPF